MEIYRTDRLRTQVLGLKKVHRTRHTILVTMLVLEGTLGGVLVFINVKVSVSASCGENLTILREETTTPDGRLVSLNRVG